MYSEDSDQKIVFSYGGGRQTVAMCVMIAKGVLPKPDIIVIDTDETKKVVEQCTLGTCFV